MGCGTAALIGSVRLIPIQVVRGLILRVPIKAVLVSSARVDVVHNYSYNYSRLVNEGSSKPCPNCV
jgi:hypothetical protein